MNIATFLTTKRARYETLPAPVRWAALGGAFVLGLGGVVLLFVPIFADLGALLILVALGILSLRFSWARAALEYANKKLADKSFRKKFFALLTAVFLVIAALFVVWLVWR